MAADSLVVSQDALLDIHNISSGAFSPLKGFLNSEDYCRVVRDMRLSSGKPWVMPVTLDLPPREAAKLSKRNSVFLKDQRGRRAALLLIEDIYKINPLSDIKKIFGTDCRNHPGVKRELARSRYRIGGRISNANIDPKILGTHVYTTEHTKKVFKENNWNTVAGFQTRNPIHRAHEYLQRIALTKTDALFINPLVGWKKPGDFSPQAIIASYEYIINNFYQKERIFFGILRTAMNYAGPREAVFHAQIRKNFGCTHFIVGRDHAGVGNYYGKYAAQKICDDFRDLGIEILKMPGPFYCRVCKEITVEDICPHRKSSRIEVSGTLIRAMIQKGRHPPEEMMRREISEIILKLHREKGVFL